MNIDKAKEGLKKIDSSDKFNAMIRTASIITRVLENNNIRPIIVGGLSVEIYTRSDYTTRDIDFVSDGYETISEVLKELGFTKENSRHFYYEDIDISVEFPDNHLAGDYNKIQKVQIDDNDNYVYVISLEDIINDRLRAAVNWNSSEDIKWGFTLLSRNFDSVDFDYLYQHIETDDERNEFDFWMDHIKKHKTMDYTHLK